MCLLYASVEHQHPLVLLKPLVERLLGAWAQHGVHLLPVHSRDGSCGLMLPSSPSIFDCPSQVDVGSLDEALAALVDDDGGDGWKTYWLLRHASGAVAARMVGLCGCSAAFGIPPFVAAWRVVMENAKKYVAGSCLAIALVLCLVATVLKLHQPFVETRIRNVEKPRVIVVGPGEDSQSIPRRQRLKQRFGSNPNIFFLSPRHDLFMLRKSFLTKANAAQGCKALGTELTTEGQLEDAVILNDAQWTDLAWIDTATGAGQGAQAVAAPIHPDNVEFQEESRMIVKRAPETDKDYPALCTHDEP